MKLLIDSDMLLFRAATATEVEVELEPDVWTRHSVMDEAMEMYWDQIKLWCDEVDATFADVMHCFTDYSAYRRDLFPQYKANRKGRPKPIGYKAMRNKIMREDNAFMYHKIEADDVIGLLAGMIDQLGEPRIICSGDKDLRQIHGHHIWINTNVELVGQEDAERFTYQQYLQGDSTDGIPGCPTVGEIRAKEIVSKFDLSEPVDCWQTIVRTYEAKREVRGEQQFTEAAADRALLQARLVRVLRSGEYDFATNTVLPWNPPTR